MKTIAKVAVGLTAVAMAASAFAGGPEMAPPTINGFNIGLGFGYNSYTYESRITEFNTNEIFDNGFLQANKFGPVGEIGYTFQVNQWAFVGLRAFWEYDNQRSFDQTGNYEGQVFLQSHLAALFVVGALINDTNAAYIELGYSALWGKNILQASTDPGQVTPISSKYTLSGGVMGVGWRHYFMNNVYLDLGYNFILYANAKSSSALTLPAATDGGATLSNIRKPQVNGVTATLNYLFKV